jgi:hypothetical protein
MYDKQDKARPKHVYDIYEQSNAFDRIPHFFDDAVQYMIDAAPDPTLAVRMKTFDYRSIFENKTVNRPQSQGF